MATSQQTPTRSGETPDLVGASAPVTRPRRIRAKKPGRAPGLGLGFAVVYLSLIVLIPLAVLVSKSTGHGAHYFWAAITTPDAWSALKLTILTSLLVALVNLVMGTIIAWVLVRDKFIGKAVIDLLIDLPFALPTIVAGLVLLALYGGTSPLHVNLSYQRSGVFVALLFVTLPYVVRTVQPVLLELDRDMEQAAHSLGASQWTTFRRIVLPNLLPAMLSGAGLAFTRSIAEFGSTILISGNLPNHTQVAAVTIYNRIEGDDQIGAAAISTVLLVIALVVLVLLDVLQRRGARRG
jgi:sulfate/thiosulfate transport system permease protein